MKEPEKIECKVEMLNGMIENEDIFEKDDDDDDDDVIWQPNEETLPIDLDELEELSKDEEAKKKKEEDKKKEPNSVMFKCEHCSAVSSKRSIIVEHIKGSHSYQCVICARIYPTESRLRAHEERVHFPEKGTRRKQALKKRENVDDTVSFRMRAKLQGRPWPSRFMNPPKHAYL
jgi:hypothetical protein